MNPILNIKKSVIIFLIGIVYYLLNVKLGIILDFKDMEFDGQVAEKILSYLIENKINIFILTSGLVFLLEINMIFKSGTINYLLSGIHSRRFWHRVTLLCFILFIAIYLAFLLSFTILPLNINYFLNIKYFIGLFISSLQFFAILLNLYILTLDLLKAGLFWFGLNLVDKVIAHYIKSLESYTITSIMTESRLNPHVAYLAGLLLLFVLVIMTILLLKNKRYVICANIQ